MTITTPSLRSARRRTSAAVAAAATGALVLTLTGCSALGGLITRPGPEPELVTTAASPPVESVSWAYEGDGGPANWGSLSSDFATCSTGGLQSPIDLPAQLPAETADTLSLDLGVLPAVGEVVDTGHARQFVVNMNGSQVDYDGEHYNLLQMHAHTPSEHTIDGAPAAAEFHFVHQNDDGKLLVVGVLAQLGEPNAQWQPFIESAAGTADPETAMNLRGLFPANSGFYAYEGSLTTPPCTEGVQWIVLQTPITLSAEQVEQLSGEHAHNARPVAPLGARIIEGGSK